MNASWLATTGRPCLWLLICVLSTGCASVAHVTTLSDPACHEALHGGLTAILVEQKETSRVAGQLANGAIEALKSGSFGPRPFLLASPSGADYSFFVEKRSGGCLLRLYGRQKGFVAYTNNLTYIDTRALAPCQCSE